jgi:hypothetical protein
MARRAASSRCLAASVAANLPGPARPGLLARRGAGAGPHLGRAGGRSGLGRWWAIGAAGPVM